MSDTEDKGGEQQPQQQQPGGEQKAPAYDVAALYGSLTPDNAEYAKRRGYIKADGTFQDPNVWLDGHRNAEKLMGGEKLSMPRTDDPAELAKWEGWGKLGVPADEKGYQFQRPEMPKGLDGQAVPYDEQAETEFRALARRLNLTQSQFNGIMESEVGKRMAAVTANVNGTAAERTRIETALRKDLGMGYDATIKGAGAAIEHVAKLAGVDPGKTADMSSKILGSEETARVFIQIAKMLGEDTLAGGKDAGFASGPAAARAELERLNLDTESQKAFLNADHPGHKDMVDKRRRLNEIAHSG